MSTLPALKWSVEDPPREPRLSRPVALVVEPSTPVRVAAVRLLEDSGFQVFAAASGAEARNRMEGLYGPLDLLVADTDLPDGSGGRLARDLRVRDPGLPVLFVSSGRPEDRNRTGADELEAPVIEAAEVPGRLAKTVRALLRV